MMLSKGPIFSFCMWISTSPAPFIEETAFCPLNGLGILPKITCPCASGLVSAFSLLFHWFICVSQCQFHSVRVTAVLQSVFKTRSSLLQLSSSPRLFRLLGSFEIPYKYLDGFSYFFKKHCWDFDSIALNL